MVTPRRLHSPIRFIHAHGTPDRLVQQPLFFGIQRRRQPAGEPPYVTGEVFVPRNTIERMHAGLFARILAMGSTMAGAETAVLTTCPRMLACYCDTSRGAAATLVNYLVFGEVDIERRITGAEAFS